MNIQSTPVSNSGDTCDDGEGGDDQPDADGDAPCDDDDDNDKDDDGSRETGTRDGYMGDGGGVKVFAEDQAGQGQGEKVPVAAATNVSFRPSSPLLS